MIPLTSLTLGLAVVMLSVSAIAHGTPAEVEARTLAWRALELEAQGRCPEAAPLFRRAYTVVPAPTLALFEGRCREHMGELVEAKALYTAVASYPLDPSSPPPFSKAVREAKQRLSALELRIPGIILQDRPANVAVWLDGHPVYGTTLAVNPGGHEIAWGSPRSSIHVELTEGQHAQVSLKRGAPARDVATYTALGVGLLGVGTGVVTGLMAANRQSRLDEQCGNDVCPASAQGTLDDYRRLRNISTWSYVAGTIGLGVGGVLFVTRPSQNGATIEARGAF